MKEKNDVQNIFTLSESRIYYIIVSQRNLMTSQALFLNRLFFSESGKISQSGEQFFKTTSGVNNRPNREISPHIKSDLLIRRKCTLLGPDTDKVDVITL